MPKGKHITATEKAAIVAEYQGGATYKGIAAARGYTEATIVRLVRRELGVSGTASRPRRPPPLKDTGNLPSAKRDEVIKVYRELGSIKATAEHLHVDYATVRRRLHEWQVEVNAQARPRVYDVVPCPVCGKPVTTYASKGEVLRTKTCGAPECRAALAFCGLGRPEVSRRGTRHDNDKGGTSPQARAGMKLRAALETHFIEARLLLDYFPVDNEALWKALSVEQLGEYYAQYELQEDMRGIRQRGAYSSVWHELSRVPVYLRIVSRGEGHAAIRIMLEAGENIFERFTGKFFQDKEHLLAVSQNFQPLIAWRCVCPRQTVWTLDTVLDLPENEGTYGLCPVCGACALHIWRG